MADVFISYARSTAPQARTMARALRSLGYSVWLDDDLPAHRVYGQVIEEELERAQATLVIWSGDAVRSQWVLSEANRAREVGKLVQVVVDETPLPMPFDQVQYANLVGWSGDGDHRGWRKALVSISSLLDGTGTPRAALPPAEVRQPHAEARPDRDGERRHLAILFCDIVGSTGLAATLDPEEWHAIASQYQRTAADAVARFAGHVSKYLGDGLVVFFGYPQAQEDAAERAVRAGLETVAAVGRLNARLAVDHGVTLQVRVGIHCGTVVVAPGASDEPEIFGDAPNIAARVQEAAAPDTVVVTAAVRDLVPGLFEIADLGAVELKGAPAPMPLGRVIRPSLASRRTRVFARRGRTPFINHEDEVRLLLGRWERVCTGEGQAVLLVGEPGIGKTRLMEEFRARTRAGRGRSLECAGAPFFANSPFHAVTQLLGQSLGWKSDDDPETRAQGVREALTAAGLKTAEAAPLIAEMLNLPVPPAFSPLMLGPQQRRARLLAALAAWALSAARDQPLLLVVEDLHWVDPSTIELLQILVDQCATASLMVLCTTRPGFKAPWSARAHHVQLMINRLDSQQTRSLVAGVAARAGLARGVIDAVIERADGVPLFAEELTRLLLERGEQGSANEIPATLRDSLSARLDRLGRAKEVAQLAAVIGREVSHDLLLAVWPRTEAELQEHLAALADAELIYVRGLAPQASYRFKHALVQSAAYEALLKRRRRELHAKVARTLTERFAQLAEAQPEVLARHWTEAGQAGPAIAAWKSAGDGAFQRRAFKEAEAGYRQAMALLTAQPETDERDAGELELASALNRVLQLTRGYAAPETVEMAARARALAEKSGVLSQLIREEARLWRAVITAGDFAGAAALADHVLELAHGEPDNRGRLLFAFNAQVQTKFYTGELAEVEEQFGRLIALIETPGLRQASGNNVIPIGVASLNAWSLGRGEQAQARMGRAFALAQESKDPYDLAMALHFQGLLHACERDARAAEAVAAQLLALSEEHGFGYAGELARSTFGWALGQGGAGEEGVIQLRQAWRSLAGSGARVGMTFGLTRLAETLALAGAADEALAAIEDALAANPQERVFRPDALRVRGELRFAAGETALAEADLREAVALAQAMGAEAWRQRAGESLARLLPV